MKRIPLQCFPLAVAAMATGCIFTQEDDFGFSWGFNQYQIPIMLRKGDNQLLIKTNNRMNRNMLVWAIHCVVE